MIGNSDVLSTPFSSLALQAGTFARNILSPPPETLERRQEIQDLEPPADWDVEHYTVDGVQMPIYRAEAEKPLVEFLFCTGWKSSPLVYIPIIKMLNRYRISVIASKIYDHGRDSDFVDFDMKSTRRFFCDPRVRLRNPDVPKVAGVHSAAGGYMYRHTANPLSLAQLTNNFRGIYYLTPFFDVAGASSRFSPGLNKTFVNHAQARLNLFPSEDLKGAAYAAWLRAKGEPQIFSAHEDPTYGQMLGLCESGTIGIEAHSRANHIPIIKQHFVTANHDTASSNRTGVLAGQIVGAEVCQTDAYHNPPLESNKHVYLLARKIIELGNNPAIDPAKPTRLKKQAGIEEPRTRVFFATNPLVSGPH